MATSNDNSESSKKIRPERSLLSLGSDEESFVVLWKDTDNKSIDTVNLESISTCSLDEKTKSLINNELIETEQASLANNTKEKEDKLSDGRPTSYSYEGKEVESRADQFTILPTMPLQETETDTEGVISITAFPSDLTSEQIQKKISDLIEENTRLKYIISQNNTTMKSQYERIVAWQEDVGKVHEVHRKKIVEAKEFIEKLKMDKYKLSRELEQLKEDRASHIQEKLRQSTDADEKVKEIEQSMNNLTTENIDLSNRVAEREKELTSLQMAVYTSKNELEEAKLELIKTKSRYEDELKSLNFIIDTLKSQEYLVASCGNMANSQNQSTSTRTGLTQTQDRTTTRAHMEKHEKSQTLVDEIHAQRAQLELYRVAFEAEKKAKETVQVEKEKLLKDVNKLETHIHKLQQKMNEIRENYVIIPKSQAQVEPEECCLQ